MEEQTVAELEFENAHLHVDLNLTRLDGCMLMVDKLLSMHNHVLNYGIDRTFLAIYNENNLLDNVCGMKFPACEDVYSDYALNKQYFEACMEGLGRSISDAFKWVIEKIKALFSWIGDMWNKFWGLFKNKTDENKKIIAKLKHAVLKNDAEFNAKYVSQDAINKFDEIMNKMTSNESNNKSLLEGTGISDDELTQIETYLKNIDLKTSGPNNVVKEIHINKSGKDSLLNLYEKNTQGFEPLATAIATYVKQGKTKLAQLEAQQKNLESSHSALAEGDEKTKMGELLKTSKQKVKSYSRHVAVLSKLMKLILDGTQLTNKELKLLYKYCTNVQTGFDAANNVQKDAIKHVPST